MKKVFVLFAVGIMLFNLCACHKENTADSPTAPPSLESSSGDASTQSENQSFDMSRVWQENYDAGFDALLAESYTEAVSYFRAAVDADPTLDIGYIALAYSIAVATRDVGQTREIFQEGLANASRARLLNQSLSDFNAFTAEALATANDFFDCNITFVRYKTNGAWEKEYAYTPDNKIYLSAIFQSMENGKLTEGEFYNLDETVGGYFTDFIYEGDYITGYTILDLNGTLLRTIEFSYDTNGNRTGRTIKNFSEDGSSIIRRYNSNGQMIEETSLKADTTSATAWDYDENGNSIGYTVTDEYGNVAAWVRYIYENGNYVGFEYYDSTNAEQPYGKIYENQ